MNKPTSRVRLTARRIADFTCPTGKAQAFLWDTETPSLALRVTPTGRKTFVFESRLHGATIRIPIGTEAHWPIKEARAKAQQFKMFVDNGTDPREVARAQEGVRVAKKAAAAAHAVTVGEAWTAYLEARRDRWGERHYRDHVDKAKAGGEKAKRGTRGRKETIEGPLHCLMALKLRDLDAPTVEVWAAGEAKIRPTVARLSWRLLKSFLSWCAEQPEYAPSLPAQNPARTKKAREALGKATVKQDVLQRGQLTAWFAAVRQISNPTTAAYLQILLLTGARPGEVLALRWDDVNTKWKGMTIRDKVKGERVIPLTPYVSQILHGLPRRKESNGKASTWVFSSATAADGKLTIPRSPHIAACAVAGIKGLSLHGLRRSFKSLTEWLEIPAGVVAQIMGHKPSATAEKHYTVRPLDLLHVHHQRIEEWILEQAGVPFVADADQRKLRAVN